MSPNDSNAQHIVTVVIVAHDGARWLPEMARGLRAQTHPVHRVVAVDTGSRDRSGMLLASLFGSGSVFGAERGSGYAAAVGQALRHRAANVPVARDQWSADEIVEWIWLLHDDCEPEPDALDHLLRSASARFAAILGPKVRHWDDRRIVIEAGITIDGAGRRETGLESHELDQGQHDGERDVFAVGSAGMLIRRDVWDRLGGFDPGLLLFREDIDFCWRAIAAGYRVRLVTDAVIYHAEAAAGRQRQISLAGPAGDRPRAIDRRNALLVLFANLPLRPMATAVARNCAGSLLRTLILTAGKQPAAAWDELRALGWTLGHPLRLLRARRRRAAGRRRAYPVVRSFIPRGQTVGRLTEIIGTALAGSQPVTSGRSGRPVDEEEALLTDSGLAQRVLTNPGVLTVLALTVLALVAERSLLRGGWLGGGALTPVRGGASDLWREYLAGYHDTGLGSAANAPPYLAVLAMLATLAGGKPWLAVEVILLGCVPLAGTTAYLAARRITSRVSARVWASCAYALLPIATGAVAAGRIGTAVALVLIPAIGVLAGRMLTLPTRRARQSAWAAGFVVAVTAAFVPLVWALTVVGAVLAFLAFGRGRQQTVINFGIVALVPALLLIPWTFDLFVHPSLFLLEAGASPSGLAGPALPASSLLLLHPGGPGLPPVWVTAGFGLAALSALLLRRRRVLVAAGWGVALFGLLIAIAMSRIKVTPPGAEAAVPAWPGVPLAFTAAGVLLAAVTAAESLPRLLRARGLRRPAAAMAAIAACSAPVLVAGTWVVSGVHGPIAATRASILPEFITASADNGLRQRTLVIYAGPGSIRYSVLRNADPLPGEPDLSQPVTAERLLDAVVAGLASGGGGSLGDDGAALARFDIGYVLLPVPLDQDLVRVLDGTPGLRPVSLTGSFGLWQVTDVAARVRVIGPGGTVVPVRSGRVEVSGAAAPAGGGTLALAEPSDGGWRASLNGRPLTPLRDPVGGWAQGFTLPPGGGRLEITRGMLARQLALLVEAVATLVIVVFALPSARSAGAVEEVPDKPAPPARPPSRRRRKPKSARRGRAAPRPRRPAPARRSPRPVPPNPSWDRAGSAMPNGWPGDSPGTRPGAGVPPGAAGPPGPGVPARPGGFPGAGYPGDAARAPRYTYPGSQAPGQSRTPDPYGGTEPRGPHR